MSNYVGAEVYVSAGWTGDATPRRVKIIKYEEGWGYLCENLPGEPTLHGWFEEIYDEEGNELL